MSIPGSNLLRRALKVIKAQPVDYYMNTVRVLAPNGVYETQYASPISVLGSVQAVPLANYKALGLDFGRNYVTLYTITPVTGVERDVAGDVFGFAGKVYQCVSTTNWLAMDGWNSVMAVQVDDALPDTGSFVITPDGDFVVTPQGDFVVVPS